MYKEWMKVRKNKVIKVIQISFTHLDRREKLVIFAPASFVINDIEKNIVYSTLEVNH